LYAEGADHVSIRGEGTIDGQGAAYKVTTNAKPARYMNRPFVIRFVQCANVRIEGITMTSSPMWMQQYLACENLRIHGIRVYNHANKNNDMMDIDGCRNVVISDCIGDTDDDGITLKSTSPFVTENVTITNCVLSSHCNAFKTGTESTGGFRNIAISNIVVKPSRAEKTLTGHPGGISGFILASVDGGILEGVMISNIRIDGPQVPFAIRLGNRARKHTDSAPNPPVSIVRDIAIRGITADHVGAIGCSITGIPGHPVERVSIGDIRFAFAGGGTPDQASRAIPELDDAYPEATMWGTVPAYGFFIRHAAEVSMSNIDLSYAGHDSRPVLVAEDVTRLRVQSLCGSIDVAAPALIVTHDVRESMISSSMLRGETEVFLRAGGVAPSSVSLIGNMLGGAHTAVIAEPMVVIKSEGNIK
jgi:hypothetical protein